jgi:hypothetical protein
MVRRFLCLDSNRSPGPHPICFHQECLSHGAEVRLEDFAPRTRKVARNRGEEFEVSVPTTTLTKGSHYEQNLRVS